MNADAMLQIIQNDIEKALTDYLAQPEPTETEQAQALVSQVSKMLKPSGGSVVSSSVKDGVITLKMILPPSMAELLLKAGAE